MVENVVVVGAGLAAHKVVENLRKEGYTGRLVLVGDEKHRPYDRPGLSKAVLLGDAEPKDLYLAKAGFYEEKDVETHFGDAATAIDREARTVTLASGAVLDYDALVLATGSTARRLDLPGADLDCILTLRKFEDTLALLDALTPGTKLVIVGGGWIGLEVASAAIEADCSVTVLEHFELPLLNVLGADIAGWFARLHRGHGVDLRTGVGVAGFEGSGRVTGVRLDDGEVVPADVVLVGVGAIPNTDLAAAAGLRVDNGVRVDEHLRTDDPHVYAVGDIANAHNTALGHPLRVEHWDNARRQGRLAAVVLLDRDDVYDWQPYFYSDQYDVAMEYLGRGGRDDELVVRGSLDDDHFSAYWLAGGDTVTAAMQVNEPRLAGPLRKIVGQVVDRGRLADPGVPLEEHLAG